MEQCRQAVSCLENENHTLKDGLSHAEAKISRLDIQKIALQGDLQRHQIVLQDKDSNLKALQEKIECQSNDISSLEECCANMKLTIDQLKSKIEQAGMLETELRTEIKNLQKIKSNQEHNLSNDNDKIKQLQKTLLNSENERRILSDRLESSQQSMIETKRQNQSILTQLQRCQEQIASLEIQKSSIDSQLKLLQWKESNVDSNRFETNFPARFEKDSDANNVANMKLVNRTESQSVSKIFICNLRLHQTLI